MIERYHTDLSVGEQCALLSIPRSSFYYTPQGETEQNLALMQLIDVQFLETPFFGVRQMTWHLLNEGHEVNESNHSIGTAVMQLECSAWPSTSNSMGVIHPAG
jgi:hypothetical protein